ncbi:MAG: sulfotransferase domain-containing protein [Thermoplasmatales archaeon]|nr:MAG: sulfotransferase domain-containing protein [Thermoplasmatales archaeon]
MAALPTFIICGTQKGGTTSLYYYLYEHPKIYMAKNKEVRYFDLNYHRGVKWYKKHFNDFKSKKKTILGEASPTYMYFEEVPERIKTLLPNVKLIFILRNPVDRAYSHYWHAINLGYEHLCFEEAIKKEEERLSHGDLFQRQHYSYRDMGKYIVQLKRFRKYFPKEQMLIILTENLKDTPEKVMNRTFNFLEIEDDLASRNWQVNHLTGKQPYIWKLQRLKSIMTYIPIAKGIVGRAIDTINLREGYPRMNLEIRKDLLDYFKPYNKELERFLERKLDRWYK